MYRNQEIGKMGEEIACEYLKKNNYNIIEKNFRCRQGEIDIVGYDVFKKEIVFFEVKTRESLKYGHPSEAVDNRKIQHILRSAEYYLYLRKLESMFIRIDVIEVYVVNKRVVVNHIKQAIC